MENDVARIAEFLLAKYGSEELVKKEICFKEIHQSGGSTISASWIADKVMMHLWKAQKSIFRDCGICVIGSDLTEHRFYGFSSGSICYVRIPSDTNWDTEIISENWFIDIVSIPTILSRFSPVAVMDIAPMEIKHIERSTTGKREKSLDERMAEVKEASVKFEKRMSEKKTSRSDYLSSLVASLAK